MIVVVTRRARSDLLNIQRFIGEHNLERAETFVGELLDRCSGLSTLANAFPFVPRYEHYGIRRRSHGDYLIFYIIDGDRVEVIHISHGARDYSRLLMTGSE